MKRFHYTVFAVLALMMASISGFAQVGKAAEGGSKATVSPEMPAALKSMEGKPGYEEQLQKWENSLNLSPAENQAQAEKAIQELNAAEWKAPEHPQSAKSAAEGAPYYNYNGITDPVKAKEAWFKDQAPTSGK